MCDALVSGRHWVLQDERYIAIEHKDKVRREPAERAAWAVCGAIVSGWHWVLQDVRYIVDEHMYARNIP